MNRPAGVPQSLRGMPAGFQNQQQQQQQQANRSVSARLPNGKLGGNNSGWAFGAGVPMTGAATAGARQLGSNVSFAQSLSGSQPSTPLDLSEFPSLSNNQQASSGNPSSMWSAAGARNVGGPPVQRNQPTPLSAQQNQHEDMFAPNSRLSSAQGSFRFGNQTSASRSSQTPQSAADDFPPLNRNVNGDIGQERGSNLMSSLGFGSQAAASAGGSQSAGGNGLLNALSANARASEARSPVGTRPQDGRSSVADDDTRQKQALFRDESVASQSPLPAGATESPNALGAIGNEGVPEETADNTESQVQDPLEGMSQIDKWGLKGLRTLMEKYPDYNALMTGMDPNALGLDMSTNELLSAQIYSPFDDVPPRPAIPKFRLPECYKVTNVGPIENKITSFNEETLMWIFYSCPNDIKQQLAAVELNSRNWRWHKKLQIWLTKDDMMVPQVLSHAHERGYYIIWDIGNWRKERREFTLHYADLDTNLVAVGSAA